MLLARCKKGIKSSLFDFVGTLGIKNVIISMSLLASALIIHLC